MWNKIPSLALRSYDSGLQSKHFVLQQAERDPVVLVFHLTFNHTSFAAHITQTGGCRLTEHLPWMHNIRLRVSTTIKIKIKFKIK